LKNKRKKDIIKKKGEVMNDLISTGKLAKLLGVSLSTIYRWFKILTFAKENNYKNIELIGSGLNYNKKGFKLLLNKIVNKHYNNSTQR
jgi:predicted site-specific integrase-resolvase